MYNRLQHIQSTRAFGLWKKCARFAYYGQSAFTPTVFVLGLAVVAGAYFLRRIIQNKIFLSLLVLCGIGIMGVGIFPEDFGIIHFCSFFNGLFVWGIVSHSLLQVSETFIILLCSYFRLDFVGGAHVFGLKIDLSLGIGGMERMITYPILLWAIGSADT